MWHPLHMAYLKLPAAVGSFPLFARTFVKKSLSVAVPYLDHKNSSKTEYFSYATVLSLGRYKLKYSKTIEEITQTFCSVIIYS